MAKASIKSIAQTEKAGLFSICFEGESYSEFQKFFNKFKNDAIFSEELQTILAALKHMMENAGFLERRFRPEGKMRDDVCAIPLETCKLRLYCLRLSDSVLIAGNGGVKNSRTYNEDEELTGYVVTLQKLDEAIKVAIRKGEVTIEEKTINGVESKMFEL